MTVQQEISASPAITRAAVVRSTVLPVRPALIRLLGPFDVQRGDGTVVEIGEWRTGRTADLVRMLALADGSPVPAAVLVAALWPAADPVRGHGSLRTAASQARKVLGGNHIERTLSGLRLQHAWVDVTRFRSLAAAAHRHLAAGQFAEAHTTARDAVALYRGELRAHDRSADWARSAARALAVTAVQVAGDAAEAALTLGMFGESVDLARQAVQWDPFDERASRLSMQALAASGQLSAAMREYERCRSLLADELGIDPSPETRALHLALLRRRSPVGPTPTGGYAATAVVTATDRADVSVETMLALVRDVYLPQRQFVRARRLTGEIARRTVDPASRARALVLEVVPDVLLGNGSAAATGLFRARELAGHVGRSVVGRRIDLLELLVAHDRDGADFPARWADAAARCEVETDVNWSFALVRIAVERGDLAAAGDAARLPTSPAAGPLARQLSRLALARWELAAGRHLDAARRMAPLVASPVPALSALVLPEALTTMATATAGTDLDGARTLLGRLDVLAREAPLLPREDVLRGLAQAAVRAAEGRDAAAAAAAAVAADTAEATGLVCLAARARDLCLGYAGRARDGGRIPAGGLVRPAIRATPARL